MTFELQPDERKTLDILMSTGPGRGPYVQEIAQLVKLVARFMDYVIAEESRRDSSHE